jgi:hypothetical protein
LYSLERLSDLDELILSCRTDKSKEYISEAVACYRAGAYRAVIVNTWIAIVYDLIDKMRELAAGGDGAAKKLIDDFEKHQKQINEGNEQAIKYSLEFERNILKTAKEEMEFFDQQQLVDLSRLREDRHRCAHPSFHHIDEPYRPSAEQARMHLRNAIKHVLSQRPVQGKAAIKNIVTIVGSNYFPTDPEKAVIQLEKSEFSNPKASLVKNLIDKLMFGYFDNESRLKFSHKTIAAIRAVILMQREIAEGRVATQINRIFIDVADINLVHAVGLALEIPEAACSLDQASRDKAKNFIQTGPPNSVISILRLAMHMVEFQESCINRISSLELNDLSDGILNYQLGKLAVDRAITLYENVRNWESANSVAEKAIIPLVTVLTKDELSRILKAPNEHGADILGSHGFSEFMNSLKGKSNIPIEQINEVIVENGFERYRIEVETEESAA